MGYQIRKEGNGSTWAVYDCQDTGKTRTSRYIAKKSKEFRRLGFDREMSISQAKRHAESLRAQHTLLNEERRIARIQSKIELGNTIECAYLPDDLRREFEGELQARKIRKDHWETTKGLIRTWPRHPKEWRKFQAEFYQRLATRGYSLDYCGRLRRAMNEWGDFFTEKYEVRFSPIKAPTGSDRSKIALSYERFQTTRRKRPSGRLSLRLLDQNRDKFSHAEYMWLFISITFGLRPEELEISLRDPQKHAVKGKYLYVYQPKLERTMVDARKRWKKIEAVLPQQETALKWIVEGKFERPRTLKDMIDSYGRRLTHYAGRKEFFPFMINKGFDEHKVTRWLGHRDSGTARRHYDDPFDSSPFGEVEE